MEPLKGVDISEMNGAVDFAALKAAGVRFVIIRCGYGNDSTYQDDARFAENVRKAEAANMPWGTYLYSYALDTDMAKSEARHVLRLLGGKKPAYGVWYDVEDKQQANADLVSICGVFCAAVESAGLYVGIYSMLSWMHTKLNAAPLDKYDKWVAQWNDRCTYSKPYGIWQYTDHFVIGGKGFDGNWAYKDYPALTGKKKEDKDLFTYENFKQYMDRYKKEEGDKAASAYAKEAWEEAAAAGFLDGTGPRLPLERQQAAVLYKRLKERQG